MIRFLRWFAQLAILGYVSHSQDKLKLLRRRRRILIGARVTITLVRVPVSVINRKGRFVPNQTSRSFTSTRMASSRRLRISRMQKPFTVRAAARYC